ncbi:MAG TPA: PhnD/SsuA/transferrin family substrate-binding protein [Planctomycetota bacterium]|nr:PhnD/SsuA/transferrin family substrate-binding protein [Planctomycetota bacterium]
MRSSRCVVVGLLAAVALPLPHVVAQESARLLFSSYSFRKATEVWKQFQPATRELSCLLTRQMGQPTEVELLVTKTYEECVDGLVDGDIDLVRVGPASYVLAKQRNPAIQLLAAEREDSRGVGLIVVRADSPLQKLTDLVGKKFAFGDDQSTIGRYLSQAELVRAGVLGKDLASFQYLQRHDIVFKAVELGDFDAGALHADCFHEMNRSSQVKLRVLHSFDNVPKPWVARAGLDAKITAALRESLLHMDNPKALKALKVPGLAPVTDAEYDLVRRGMEMSERFAPESKVEPAPPRPAPTKG